MRTDFSDLQIVDIAENESGYNYYGFMSSGDNSRYVILREKTDGTEYRYAFGIGTSYATDWVSRDGLNFITPNELQGRG